MIRLAETRQFLAFVSNRGFGQSRSWALRSAATGCRSRGGGRSLDQGCGSQKETAAEEERSAVQGSAVQGNTAQSRGGQGRAANL